MNCHAHYDRLIARARDRVLEGYSERHHIIPKSMGGSNAKDNIVRLTAEEHYVAHQLLVKIYPHNRGMISAAIYMGASTKKLNRTNNKVYGWLRRALAKTVSEREISAETRKKIGLSKIGKHYSLGLKRSDETRRRNSEAKKGKPLGPRGYGWTEEQKAAVRGKPKSPEHRAALSAANSTPEARALISERSKGRVWSEDSRKRASKSAKKRTDRRHGFKMSEESKAKLAESQRIRLAKNPPRRTAKGTFVPKENRS